MQACRTSGYSIRRSTSLGSYILCGTLRRLRPDAWLGGAIMLAALLALAGGCVAETDSQSQNHRTDAFPAAGDLAFIAPLDDARIRAVDVLPKAWLDKVVDALERSDLAESIDDENFREDWRLVAGRFVPCSPLGKVADREEIDRLCWPQVRLVWQPVVHGINIRGRIRPNFGDDRAIHTLFRVDPFNPSLQEVLKALAAGGRLTSLPPSTLHAFEAARDHLGLELLHALAALRGLGAGYGQLGMRPELFEPDTADVFYEKFSFFVQRFAPAEALHELTAFSLPLGRNPAGSDLWSFVAFAGEGGTIEQIPLTVHDASNGEPLYSFPESEDVTTSMGDPELDEALVTMSEQKQARILDHVIQSRRELDRYVDRINDPYQTLVPNTSCSSCHRFNRIGFDFHNLSYFEDREVTIAPRVRRDVERDLAIARKLHALHH